MSDSRVAFLIGTDEAGYGPNLGPLAIAATVWQVPDNWQPDNLYEHLAEVISPRLNNQSRLVLADSKVLYQPAQGIGALESQVLAALRVAGISLATWEDAWCVLTPTTSDELAAIPWYRGFNVSLPLCALSDHVAAVSEKLARGLSENGVVIKRLRAMALFPSRFNDLCLEFGNKAAVLSHITIELVRELAESCKDQSLLIHCDKHGGRNRYLALLQHFFPDVQIQVVAEGRQQSVYRWSADGRAVAIRFVAKGERFPPSALASMIAKYLRELAMHAFNEYWRRQVPDIRPTAGYPVDARRFKQDIADQQRTLGIDDRVLWRNR